MPDVYVLRFVDQETCTVTGNLNIVHCNRCIAILEDLFCMLSILILEQIV